VKDTPRSTTVVQNWEDGTFGHFGVKTAIVSFLENNSLDLNDITIDGLPFAESNLNQV
jgi:hypothetical protein